jgi:FMN-dependent NADH-azoreductase
MAKVLFVKANPKADSESNTFRLANEFVNEYKKIHPEDEIITLDLYKEGIKPLDGIMLKDMFSGVKNDVYNRAVEFASMDKYIIAAPMWNLSSPAILKAYFDYVVFNGISFKYTAEGPVGLLKDKPRKAIHIVTRGGAYSEGPTADFEMGDRYIRTIFGFMGVTDVSTLSFDLTNVLLGEELERAREAAHSQAKEMAQMF